MKFKQLMKYKWSILFMIVAVFILCNSIREGFSFTPDTIGEYEYLKPLGAATTLDETTVSKFETAFNNVNKSLTTKADGQSMPTFLMYATLEEFTYYINNNKWPYGSYISNYIKNNFTKISSKMESLRMTTNTPTLDMVQQIWPTRMAYLVFASEEESKQTPKPLSYDIYTGAKPPPDSTSSPDSSPSSDSTPSESDKSVNGLYKLFS